MGVHVRHWKQAYWLDIVHKGQRIRKRVGTGPGGKKSAEQAAIKIQARLAAGGDLSDLDTGKPALTFKQVAEEWLERYPALHAIRPATLENYQKFVTHHLVPYFGDRPITSITVESIEDFIEAKRAPGGSVRHEGKALGDATLRLGLVVFGLILQRAVRTKLLPGNPMRDVEWRGLPRRAEQGVDPFTPHELRAILQAAHAIDPDLATMLRLWAQSGMREGEVLGLQQHDLDPAKGIALVRRTWSRERLGPTKTGWERRVSFLHPVADDTPDWRPGSTRDAWSVIQGLQNLKVTSMDPAAFVFGRGGQPMRGIELRTKWRRVLVAAKVRYRPPEQLRHSMASTLLSRNAPLLYVQQQGGWRSAAVLLQAYARWLPQEPFQTPTVTQASPMSVAGFRST